MKSEFYINFRQHEKHLNKALDFLVKSFKYKYESPQWKICRLKYDIYMGYARKRLKIAQKYIYE